MITSKKERLEMQEASEDGKTCQDFFYTLIFYIMLGQYIFLNAR